MARRWSSGWLMVGRVASAGSLLVSSGCSSPKCGDPEAHIPCNSHEGYGGDSGLTDPVGGSGAGGSGAGTSEPTPSVETILDEYRTWQPQTPEPVAISSYIFGLCRMPTLPEQQFADSEHGQGRYLQDWANAEEQAGLPRQGSPPFLPGAAIVKEKYVAGASGQELVALGIMIKRDAGFSPADGDWEYAYYEPDLGMFRSESQQQYCAGCHASAADSDHVYVDGLEP